MPIRNLPLVLLMALLLVACTTPPTSVPTATVPTQPTTTPSQPTAALPPTSVPSAQPTVASPPTAAPAQPTAAPPTSAPSQPTAVPTATQPTAAFGEEVLLLRKSALLAFDLATKQQRQIADGVQSFAATTDGELIVLVRGTGAQAELWTVRRDGSALTQITRNDRAEATPSWSPDGLSLVFASAAINAPYVREWAGWSHWCAASTVELLNLADNSATALGAGCDPTFSPDGLRIAFAAPPTTPEPDFPDNPPLNINSIRLVNRKGQNGWDFAKAAGVNAPAPHTGRVVYAPAWSPDAKQLVYHRFMGYQALVDINVTEIGGSLAGNGKLLEQGAGWLLPAQFAPDGRALAISENNAGDARGFGGYDNWSVTLLTLAGSHTVTLPAGSFPAVGQVLDQLPRGQAAAWSPDGTALAVELPPGWTSTLPPDQPVGVDEQPGEVWRWRPGGPPNELLFNEVDFASPLVWLPAAPQVATSDLGYQLIYPTGWQLAPPTEFEERTAIAPDTLRLISAAPSHVDDPNSATAAQMFGFFVAEGAKEDAPVVWPDGSVCRSFSGMDTQGRAIAGMTRIVSAPGDGQEIIALYVTTPERWPLERPLAQALLARAGPTR